MKINLAAWVSGQFYFLALPPPYVCILCRGWRGWVWAGAGVGCANVVRLTHKKPRVITTQGEVIEVDCPLYYSVGSLSAGSVGSVGSVSLVAGSYLNLQMLPPINLKSQYDSAVT